MYTYTYTHTYTYTFYLAAMPRCHAENRSGMTARGWSRDSDVPNVCDMPVTNVSELESRMCANACLKCVRFPDV